MLQTKTHSDDIVHTVKFVLCSTERTHATLPYDSSTKRWLKRNQNNNNTNACLPVLHSTFQPILSALSITITIQTALTRSLVL